MISCRFCSQPVDVCREQDKNLIKPFHGDLTTPSTVVNNWRWFKAFCYANGYYNPLNDRVYSKGFPTYEYYQRVLQLPLCVFENDFYYRNEAVVKVSESHIDALSIEKEYKQILIKLLEIN